MPQMMPINWMLSFLFFIWIFIMFNMLNYYIFFYKIKFNINKIYKKNKLNWKW
uniref:ATP synthase F0 subunit 8 n=1 Tax=Albulina orbitula TaxID=689475 RepID=UPI0022F2F231|nr:ATP synthase F0 subunit 8 [Agriades orbitulus]WAK98822.1 ATP synthase F0 subunit 8 [Agriades orbitulus]WAK98835.1 ATP synthase F0 subunit 8 [Agriades orbitulus]WAK98848.1 ATP synthase F0 subunit 8 [Agriades orbitulus]